MKRFALLLLPAVMLVGCSDNKPAPSTTPPTTTVQSDHGVDVKAPNVDVKAGPGGVEVKAPGTNVDVKRPGG